VKSAISCYSLVAFNSCIAIKTHRDVTDEMSLLISALFLRSPVWGISSRYTLYSWMIVSVYKTSPPPSLALLSSYSKIISNAILKRFAPKSFFKPFVKRFRCEIKILWPINLYTIRSGDSSHLSGMNNIVV